MLSRVSLKDAPTSPHDTLRKTARILAGSIAQPSHYRKHSQEVPLITLREGLLHRAVCVLPVSITIKAGDMGRMVVSLVIVKQQPRKCACFSSRNIFFFSWILMLKPVQNIETTYS